MDPRFHYAGLLSTPPLAARTSTTQQQPPVGPEAYRILKELRPVSNHPISEVWEENLSSGLRDLLRESNVK